MSVASCTRVFWHFSPPSLLLPLIVMRTNKGVLASELSLDEDQGNCWSYLKSPD